MNVTCSCHEATRTLERRAILSRHLLFLIAVLLLSSCGSSNSNNAGSLNDDSNTTGINRENYTDILAHVFSLYAGDIYNEPLIALSQFTIEGRNPDGTFIDVHVCETGGFEQIVDPSPTLAGVSFGFSFNSCQEDGIIRDGDVHGQNSGYGESITSDNGFSMQVNADLNTRFSGNGNFNTSMSRSDSLHQWQTVGLSLNSNTIDGKLDLESANSTFGYGLAGDGIYKAWLSGGFTVRSDFTRGMLVSVTTPVALSYECDPGADLPCNYSESQPWAFTSGQLELIAEDGSTLLLDADTPVQETLNITISNDSGIDSFDAQWSDWQRYLSFNRFPAESPDRRSAQSLATAELDSSPAIRPDNHAALLDHVFDILTGVNALEPLGSAQDFLVKAQPAETVYAEGIRVDTYQCDIDGTATAWRVDNEASIYPLDYRLSFTQCDLGEYQVDGDIRGQEIRSTFVVQGIRSENLQWFGGNGDEVYFKGQSAVRRASDGNDTLCSLNTNAMNLYTRSVNGSEGVVTGGTRFEVREGVDIGVAMLLTGSFQVTSEGTGGFEIDVSVENLETPNSENLAAETWSFHEGKLTLTAYDKSSRWSSERSRLEFQAADSIIEIFNSEGYYSIDAPWTSWRQRFPEAHAELCRNGVLQ